VDSLATPRPRLALLLGLVFAALALAAFATLAADAPAQGVGAQQVGEDDPEEWEDDPGDDEWADDEWADDEELEADFVDEEVVALEQATGELGRAKRAAAGKLARLSRSSQALRPCIAGGRGWKRIRAIEHRPQRALYAASARRLLADMRRLLDVQQPRIVAYRAGYERFVANLRGAGIADPIFVAAIAAQARRLASYQQIAAVKASCAVFNKLTKRVREFPTRSAAQIVRADYRAAPIARRIERHVSGQLAKIDRRSGVTYRDAEALADAAELMVELGGQPGYATGFQYALSLR
jgi:hypothetical protein